MKKINQIYKLFVKFILTLILIVIFIYPSQIVLGNLHKDTFFPPSPNAAEIGRFSAMQVGLFTGTAQYSIPIYEFKSPHITLPIRLDYSSNGLMVDKIASWVGFDWSLHVGGVINRFRKGKVDMPGVRPDYPVNWNSLNNSEKMTFLYTLKTSRNDLEPDEFVFSFLDYSGKFVFDANGIPTLIPFSNLKIETNTTGQDYSYFIITTPDGIKYRFEDVAYAYPSSEPSFITSWHLSKIIHPCGDVVTFNYTKIPYTNFTGVSQYASVIVSSTNGSVSCPATEAFEKVNSIQGTACFLDNIDFPGYGKILFIKTQNREDSGQDYKLDKIKIVDNSNVLIKSFQFYFQFPQCHTNYQSGTTNGLTGSNNGHNRRMFLDSLQIQDKFESRVNSYLFSYNDLNGLPARYSYSQDHWGYFNGKPNNDFAPLSSLPSWAVGYFTNHIPTWANREPDYIYSQKGMLNKIIFPTRGYTTIEYEPNKDMNAIQKGGCRVLRTKTYKSSTAIPEIKKYIYLDATFTNNSLYYREYANYAPESLCFVDILSSDSFYNLYKNGMYHVFYPKVEILDGENGENGKNVHRFIYNDDQKDIPLNGYEIYPNPKSNTGWNCGLLEYRYITDNTLTNNVWSNFIDNNFSETRNKKIIDCLVVQQRDYQQSVVQGDDYLIKYYDIVPYKLYSIWHYVSQENITSYHSNGNVNETTKYFYDNSAHAQLSRVETIDSKNVIKTKTYKYPLDYYSSTNICETNKQNCLAAAAQNRDNMLQNCYPLSDPFQREMCFASVESTYNYALTQCENEYNACSSTDEQVISEMKNKNMINTVIEEQNTQLQNSIKTLIGGTIRKYKNQAGLILPYEEYSIELNEPTSNLTSSSINSSGILVYHPQYNKKLTYDRYDNKGNIMQTTEQDGLVTSYLWSYNQAYPVAKLVNGKFSSDPTLSEAAYIGFESYEKSNDNPDNDYWSVDRGGQTFTTDAKVGQYAWYMSSDYGPTRKVKPASQTCTYTFSGWAKTPASFNGECYLILCANDANGYILPMGYNSVSIGNTGGQWKYFQVSLNLANITSPISTIAAYPWKISGSEVTVDELRLQPSDSQFTTYTHSPLIGMTSQTDPNGITTYYEYDSFGRLKNVKDHEGNILKQTQYHYQNQP